MQKLLFILICLLLSFEVRSENDDLSGKKLVCTSKTVITGLEFLDIKQVKKIKISKLSGTSNSNTYKYSTTPTNIFIGTSAIVDRLKLTMTASGDCKLIEDNLDSYMNDKLEIILNEIKSKRKI